MEEGSSYEDLYAEDISPLYEKLAVDVVAAEGLILNNFSGLNVAGVDTIGVAARI